MTPMFFKNKASAKVVDAEFQRLHGIIGAKNQECERLIRSRSELVFRLERLEKELQRAKSERGLRLDALAQVQIARSLAGDLAKALAEVERLQRERITPAPPAFE